MKILVGNVKCTAVIGGKDHLLKCDLAKELREYLRVRPEGYWHSLAYKIRGADGERKWDGWKYFINKEGDFASGFLPLVAGFAESLGATVELIDKRENVPVLRDELVTDVRHHDMMVHQSKAVGKLRGDFGGIAYPRGVFYCATNSGKTTMAAGVHLNLVKPKGTLRSLFIVHTREIYDQAVEFFQAAGISTGGIKSGKRGYDTGGDMTVGMIKTMDNLLKRKDATFLSDLNNFDVVFIDEGHHAGAPGYSRVMQACKSASVRIVLSGTALENKDKVKNMIVVGLSGPVLAKIKNTDMFEAGVSKRPHVKVLASPHLQGQMMTYDQEYNTLIATSKPRMKAIMRELKTDLGKRTIITFEEIGHGEFMYEFITLKAPELRVALTHGQDKNRSEKFRMFKEGKLDLLLVSMIVQEGLNLPGIKRMVFAHGGKAPIRQKQLAGRGMRRAQGEEDTFEIIEVWDRGLYTEKHSRARMKIYKEEGFILEYMYPNRKGRPVEK